jgi:hypothetical protein
MKAKGPILTLLVGLVLATISLGVSVVADRSANADDRRNPARTAGTVTATPSTAPTTEPTATPSGTAGSGPEEGTSVEPSRTPSPPVTYAGRVDGGEVAIAIAVRDGQGVAYVCNGKKLEAWFQGPAGDGQLALTGKNGATITGTHDGQVAAGTVTIGSRKWTFRIPMVQAPAGLYKIADKVANASVQGGWVVYKDGQTGSLTVNGRTDTAPRLNTETGEVVINGVTVKPSRL